MLAFRDMYVNVCRVCTYMHRMQKQVPEEGIIYKERSYTEWFCVQVRYWGAQRQSGP